MKILTIGAHPDDEILGPGASLVRHRERGDELYVCILTCPYTPNWSEEYIALKVQQQAEVDAFLGIQKRFNLDLPTVKLNTLPHGEINARVSAVVREVQPDIIYTHFSQDLNQDHGIAFHASMVAARPPFRGTILAYETVSETDWNLEKYAPNHYQPISEAELDLKIKAFQLYSTEQKAAPHARSPESIRVLAQKRGMEVNLPLAEAFMYIRGYGN